MRFVAPTLSTAQTDLLARVCLGAAEDQWFAGTAEQLMTLSEFFTYVTENPSKFPPPPKMATKIKKLKRAHAPRV